MGDPFESGTIYHSGVPELNPDFVYGDRVAHLYFSVFVHVERSFFSLFVSLVRSLSLCIDFRLFFHHVLVSFCLFVIVDYFL